MPIKPKSDWTFIGRSEDCEHYSAPEGRLLYIIPDDDAVQTEEAARGSLAVQAEHWSKVGHGGAVIIFMDPIREQTAGAREVYAKESGDTGAVCFALIGESYYAMASASVYAGLARPSVALEVFRSVDEAMPWVQQKLAERATR